MRMALSIKDPEADRLASAIESDTTRLVSAATLLEAGIVIESRRGTAGGTELDLLVAKAGLVVEPVTADQSAIAREAWRRFGKGRHVAGLNPGDCFAYALARP